MATKVVPGLTTNERMSLIMEEHRVENEQEGDMTVKEAMEIWGLGETQSRRKLNELVGEGVFEKLDGKLKSGYSGCFYRLVEVQ